jgi:hypothetical protein
MFCAFLRECAAFPSAIVELIEGLSVLFNMAISAVVMFSQRETPSAIKELTVFKMPLSSKAEI